MRRCTALLDAVGELPITLAIFTSMPSPMMSQRRPYLSSLLMDCQPLLLIYDKVRKHDRAVRRLLWMGIHISGANIDAAEEARRFGIDELLR